MNNSVRKNVIAMKLRDFLQLLILQLLKKFHWNIMKNEGAGDNFLGLTQEKSQILKSQLLRKKEQKWNILRISFVICYLMYSIINIMFGWKICSKFNFISIFLILANFAAFLDHTKEDADVSKNGGYFRLIFIFTESTCLRLLAHQIWLLYLLPVKS